MGGGGDPSGSDSWVGGTSRWILLAIIGGLKGRAGTKRRKGNEWEVLEMC